MIRIDETTGQVPTEQLMADMGTLIEELTRTGQLVSTAGLRHKGLVMPSWTNAVRMHCRWIIVAAGGVLGCVAIGGRARTFRCA